MMQQLTTWLRMEVALAIPTLATLCVSFIASTTHPMPDIANSAVLSTNCVWHYATNNPIGDNVRSSPRKIEREWDSMGPPTNTELGALDKIVTEPPGIYPMRRVDDVVSSTTVPTMCWELLRNESCEHVSSVCFVGDNIFHNFWFVGKNLIDKQNCTRNSSSEFQALVSFTSAAWMSWSLLLKVPCNIQSPTILFHGLCLCIVQPLMPSSLCTWFQQTVLYKSSSLL